MQNLSPAGNELVQRLSQQHGLSTDAVTHMLIAVHNGNGSMAQFNHPEFGGSGQWMSGGMTMVSDLFNNQLKYRVSSLCADISDALYNHQLVPFSGSFQSQSQGGSSSQSQAAGQIGSTNSLFVPDPTKNWWPSEMGSPNAIGSQNNVRYAYFANSHRLAVNTGGGTWVYDTLNHQIGGFSQQQGSGGSITFTSQFGVVNLSTLPVISRDGVPAPPQQTHQPAPNPPQQPVANSHNAPQNSGSRSDAGTAGVDVIETLDRLGGLLEKGYISQQEFESKKADLLGRL
ncbi:SHOCT domain-containing protein [Rosistilla carotiformis]|uniref:SHOCT domain-containing protein n=1 Tax=Rosistilla carotiformis TaxID=2528017 RepID=UPI00119EFF27|nr:SHOCT domain-containing protein [Rosistilla carotiformis]